MSKRILVIGGSPRRQGNSDRLLNSAVSALEEQGFMTDRVFLRDLNFSFCRGCNACSKDGHCVLKDDIQVLQGKLLEADRIILAAPIYFMGINAQTKAVIDRMQPFWALKYVLKKEVVEAAAAQERYGLFLSVAGTNFADTFDCAIRSVKNLFHVLDVKYAGTCLYGNIDGAGDIDRHPTAHSEVKEAALALARR